MKENIGDRFAGKIERKIEALANRMTKKYGGVPPFDSRKMTPEEQMMAWDEFGQDPTAQEQMQGFIQTYGEERVNNFIQEIETQRLNRGMDADLLDTQNFT